MADESPAPAPAPPPRKPQAQRKRGSKATAGLLSRELFLVGEDPREFRQLFDQLVADHRPQGVLETSLVEKIAICLWRQRRLVDAESSRHRLRRARTNIELQVQLMKVLSGNLTIVRTVMEHAAGLGDEPEETDEPDWTEALQMVQLSTTIPKSDDALSSYQTAIDNELYKTLRALRETQAWRLALNTTAVSGE
jgi:hypothetical protein